MCPGPETSGNWPASSPQPPGERAPGPAWFVCSECFISNISAVQAPRGANSCLLHWTPAQSRRQGWWGRPSRTSLRGLTFSFLVQTFSSLCKPPADKTPLVLAAVGSEQGAGLPGVPAPATRALPRVTGLAGFGQSCLGRRQFRKQRASVWAIPVTLKSKRLITFLLCQGWFLSYRLTQYPWIGGKRRLSILHRKLPSPKAFYYFKIYFACFCLAEEAKKDQDKLRAAMREGSWPGTQGVWRRRGERLWARIPGHWGSLWRHSCTALSLEAGRLSD